MPKISDLYFKTAIVFLIIGISVGLQMSITQNHNVIGAHAHLNLLGWVTSALFGGYYALNPAKATAGLAMAQYWVYSVGVVITTGSLYFLLLGNPAFEMSVAIGSFITFAGVLMFAWIIFMPARAAAPMGMPGPAE